MSDIRYQNFGNVSGKYFKSTATAEELANLNDPNLVTTQEVINVTKSEILNTTFQVNPVLTVECASTAAIDGQTLDTVDPDTLIGSVFQTNLAQFTTRVDGVSRGSLVLLKNQTDKAQNGIYEVYSDGGNPRLSRYIFDPENNNEEDVSSILNNTYNVGKSFAVSSNDATYGGKTFFITTATQITLGQTEIDFQQKTNLSVAEHDSVKTIDNVVRNAANDGYFLKTDSAKTVAKQYVENVDIMDNTINGVKLTNNSVDVAKLVGSGAANSGTVLDKDGAWVKVSDTNITDNAINGAKLANDTIGVAKLIDSSAADPGAVLDKDGAWIKVSDTNIADNAIGVGKLTGSSAADAGTVLDKDGAWVKVSDTNITDNTISGSKLTTNTVDTGKLNTTSTDAHKVLKVGPSPNYTPFWGYELPIGAIIMYGGNLSALDPLDWAVCDGTKGTPNLKSSFPMGSIAENMVGGYDTSMVGYEPPGISGGSNSVTLTTTNLPAHSHDIAAQTSTVNGDHRHYTGVTSRQLDNALNSAYDAFGQAEYINVEQNNMGGSFGGNIADGTQAETANAKTGKTTLTGDHAHTIAAHTTESVGDATPIDNRPAYTIVHFIMKLR